MLNNCWKRSRCLVDGSCTRLLDAQRLRILLRRGDTSGVGSLDRRCLRHHTEILTLRTKKREHQWCALRIWLLADTGTSNSARHKPLHKRHSDADTSRVPRNTVTDQKLRRSH